MTAISLPLISWLPLPSPLAQPWRLARSRSQGQGEVGELCPESQQCATVPAIPRGGHKDGRGLGQSRGQANPSQQAVGLRLCGAHNNYDCKAVCLTFLSLCFLMLYAQSLSRV